MFCHKSFSLDHQNIYLRSNQIRRPIWLIIPLLSTIHVWACMPMTRSIFAFNSCIGPLYIYIYIHQHFPAHWHIYTYAPQPIRWSKYIFDVHRLQYMYVWLASYSFFRFSNIANYDYLVRTPNRQFFLKKHYIYIMLEIKINTRFLAGFYRDVGLLINCGL